MATIDKAHGGEKKAPGPALENRLSIILQNGGMIGDKNSCLALSKLTLVLKSGNEMELNYQRG